MWEERLRTSPAPFLVLIRGKRNDSLAEKEPTDFGRLLLEALPAARDLGTDPPALPWAPSGCSPMLLCFQGCEEIGGDWRPSVERDRSPERPGEECGPRESLLRETGANAGFSRSWDRFFLLLSRLRGVARWRLTAQASRHVRAPSCVPPPPFQKSVPPTTPRGRTPDAAGGLSQGGTSLGAGHRRPVSEGGQRTRPRGSVCRTHPAGLHVFLSPPPFYR